jgi:hypothetical protein
MRNRSFRIALLSTLSAAVVVSLIPSIAWGNPQAARGAVVAPLSGGCAGMTVPEENHASIRLRVDQPPSGAQVSVDEQGKITVSGIVHKHATMTGVSDEQVATADFTLGPPPEGVAAWAVSWSARLRPPHLGDNQVCVRAERDPKRTARILRSFTVVDKIPPSDVTGLAVGDITSTGAVVSWDAATDNYGLAGYDVSVDGGSPHRTTVGARTFTITGLAPSTGHTVSVVAVDLAGNISKTPATTSFTTAGPPPPPTGGLTITPEQGAATAVWKPHPATDVSYRAFLDGQPWNEFPLDLYCQDANGHPANPCTAQDVISFVIQTDDEDTAHVFRVDVLGAGGTLLRSMSGSFTTTTSTPLVSPGTVQMDASEASRCAAMDGDFYLTPSVRAGVRIPAGSRQIFAGCYKAANDSCIRGFLPVSGNKVIHCSDDVTTLLTTLAPPGRGPVISSLDAITSGGTASPLRTIPGATAPSPPTPGVLAAATPTPALVPPILTEPITWCEKNEACTVVISVAEEAAEVAAEADVAASVSTFLVVAAEGIGIGTVLSVLLGILFPTPVATGGLVEYPISPGTDFDTFSNWGLDQGKWYNSLKLYAEVIKTTKELASTRDIPFAWNQQTDEELKLAIDQACTAQQKSTFVPQGCGTGFAVYVPGGQNYAFQPMNQTGAHIADALGAPGFPNPPGRLVWYDPAYSKRGKAATDKGFKHDWYDNNPDFNKNPCNDPPRGEGMVCDEFPFWTTNQAVNLSGELASLKPVPEDEGTHQGTDLSGFYRSCLDNFTDGKPFIVLPIPTWIAADGPSFGFKVSAGGASICRAPRPPAPPTP